MKSMFNLSYLGQLLYAKLATAQYPMALEAYQAGRSRTTYFEIANLHRVLLTCAHLPGDIAELGVYRGGTARLLAKTCPKKTLHLFDTFAGFPCKSKYDIYEIGACRSELGEVKNYLSDCCNVIFHPGLFPATTNSTDKFCFVNMDADQYQSTLDGLRYFYPRLVPGGVIILHDYYSNTDTPGVAQAVKEYSCETPVVCLPLWNTQAIIVKGVK